MNALAESEEEGLFGPGMDLVLSLFAIVLLIGGTTVFAMNQRRRSGPEFLLQLGDAVFMRDSVALTSDGRRMVDAAKPRLVAMLRDDTYHVELVGEASAEGREAFNFELGLGRARSVALALMSAPRALSPSCIQVRALGNSRSLRKHQDDRIDTLPEHVLRGERRVIVRVVRDRRARCTMRPARVPPREASP